MILFFTALCVLKLKFLKLYFILLIVVFELNLNAKEFNVLYFSLDELSFTFISFLCLISFKKSGSNNLWFFFSLNPLLLRLLSISLIVEICSNLKSNLILSKSFCLTFCLNLSYFILTSFSSELDKFFLLSFFSLLSLQSYYNLNTLWFIDASALQITISEAKNSGGRAGMAHGTESCSCAVS